MNHDYNDDQNMDWNSNPWFARHYASKLDDDFKAWWVSYYGTPGEYDDSYDEQHEYWVRCAFALIGWLAKSNDHDLRDAIRCGEKTPDEPKPIPDGEQVLHVERRNGVVYATTINGTWMATQGRWKKVPKETK